ncbi:BamA/TamA family outer membrane protein [Trichothermofontia sp.]
MRQSTPLHLPNLPWLTLVMVSASLLIPKLPALGQAATQVAGYPVPTQLHSHQSAVPAIPERRSETDHIALPPGNPATPRATPSQHPIVGDPTVEASALVVDTVRSQPHFPPAPPPDLAISQVTIAGAGTLQSQVEAVIRTQAGQTVPVAQIDADIAAIQAIGLFADVQAIPVTTPQGVHLTYQVQPNPTLRAVQMQGDQVLPQTAIAAAFRDLYGRQLNLNELKPRIESLNQWYEKNGYALAQVVNVRWGEPTGTLVVTVVEGVIDSLQVQFVDGEGNATDATGKPIKGRTREVIITRELQTRPGDVFNREAIAQDLQRLYGLGLFADVGVTLKPGQQPGTIGVIFNLAEQKTGQFMPNAGYSTHGGLSVGLRLQQNNVGGNHQQLNADVQVDRQGVLYDVRFTDPWIIGDARRTGYMAHVFNRRATSLVFSGGETPVDLPNGDEPRLDRLGGGLRFSRPLAEGWQVSLGTQYQRVLIQDEKGQITPKDEQGNDLSFSGTGQDELYTVELAAVQDRRNQRQQPTQGSLLRLSTEQSAPIGAGNILMNRIQGSYSVYVPVQFTQFTPQSEALALNVQAGTVIGDLPPYEAFALGGTDSVRGYDRGDLASSRSYVQASAEYRFPLFSIVGGTLFFDAATDLGSSDTVPGDPGGVRDKPGSGLGYGAGLRVKTPVGLVRMDYGLNNQGDRRLHFGFGDRF